MLCCPHSSLCINLSVERKWLSDSHKKANADGLTWHKGVTDALRTFVMPVMSFVMFASTYASSKIGFTLISLTKVESWKRRRAAETWFL